MKPAKRTRARLKVRRALHDRAVSADKSGGGKGLHKPGSQNRKK